MEFMPNFKPLNVFNWYSNQTYSCTAITQPVAHHITVAVEFIPLFTFEKKSLAYESGSRNQSKGFTVSGWMVNFDQLHPSMKNEEWFNING